VAEFEGGMINAIGLANPGLEAVRRDHLPWLAKALPRTRKLANIVGNRTEDFSNVVRGLEEALATGLPADGALDAFELNVSCPNVHAGGLEFGADLRVLGELVGQVRRETKRPLFVKLSPTLPDIAKTASAAVDAGADGITVVNTMPGLVIDIEKRRPALGFGSGGVSGPGLLPVGVLATWKVSRAVKVPVIGLGGVSRGEDVVQYLMAGATLVGVGTAALRDPRAPERIVSGLEAWCDRHGVTTVQSLIGTLEWPA
jgi:dihydroorotate dehydrogenase (NAD+) catalytic subunit